MVDGRSTPGSARLRRLAAGILGVSLMGALIAPAAVMAVGFASADDLITTAEDPVAPVTGNVLDNDTLALRSAGFTYAPGAHATIGSLTVASDGAYSFTPNANWTGTNQLIGWYLADPDLLDNGNEVTTYIRVTVTAVNDVPVATPQTLQTNEDAALPITLAGTDVETAAGSLVYAIVDSPAHGTLTGSGTSRTYTPAAEYSGPDSFTFTVDDGTDTSPAATVAITVNEVNDLPVATPQAGLTTNEDTDLPITLAGTDAEGSPLTYAIATQPGHGTLSGTGANQTYTPAANYNGPDSFTFKVNDGANDSAAATVALTVTAVPDLPVAPGQAVNVVYKTAKAFTLAGSDGDGDALTFTVLTQPAHGVLSGTAPNLTYTPTGAYVGADSFTYKVAAGGDETAPATVTITVADDVTPPVVAVPSVVFGAGRVNESAPLKITWSATDAGIGVISEYVVEAKVGSGAWTPIYTGIGTTITKLYPFGQNIQFRVKAKDSKNNQSDYTLSTTRKLTAYQGTSPVVTAGTWTRVASASSCGTTYYYTTSSGKYKRLTFTGVAVAFVAPRSSNGGKVTVKIDGSSYAASTYKSGTTALGQIIKAKSLTDGLHSVRVTNAQGGRRTNFDAFVVMSLVR